MEQEQTKKSRWKRIGRIFLKTLLWIFLLIIVVFLLILTPPVQNFITGKATNYLEKKLGTRVEIGRLYFTLSGKIALDDIYVEDLQKDTLLAVGELRVRMSLYKILFKGELDISSFRLDDGTIKIKRQLPDTSYNFQFIADAFSSDKEDTVEVADSAAAMAIAIGTVEFNNLRLVYKDVVAGNDVDAAIGHFDTRIEKFDLDKLHFVVPKTNISGLTANVNMVRPLTIPEEKIQEVKVENEGSGSPVLQLEFQQVSIQKAKINYNDSVAFMYAAADIGNLNMKPKKIDLEKAEFDLGDILLEQSTASFREGKTTVIATEKSTADTGIKKDNGIILRIAALGLNNVSLGYDDDNSALQQKGMDYSHIKATVASLQINNFLFNKDSIAASVARAGIKEQSGFELQELKTDFLYTDQQASLENLYLKTAGTELKRKALIRYASIESLKNDIGAMQLDLQLDDSRVLVKDILTFVPDLRTQPAFADPTTVWYLTGDIKGSVANMQISALRIRGLNDTRIDLSGRLAGLPNMDRLNADLSIREISSSRRDIALFVPAKSLPSAITLPGHLTVSGKIKGNTEDLTTDIALKTDMGDAIVKGKLQKINDPIKAVYDVRVQTRALDLGTILQDKANLGPITADFTAKGKGLDPKMANAELNGSIQSAVLKGYNYKDVAVNGSIANQQVKLTTGIVDPNIHLALTAKADLSKEFPSMQLTAMIDSIKTQALHLTPDEIVFRGKIDADFPVTNPDSLEGKLFITESLLVQNNQRIKMDTVQLLAGGTDSSRYITLYSDLVNAQLKGRYRITELGSVFQQAIQPYFAMNSGDSIRIKSPYDFTLDATVINGPVLQSFVPDLKRMDSVTLKSRFSDNNGWSADIKAPAVEIGTNKINGLDVVAGTNANDAIDIKATVEQLKSGSSIQLNNTTLSASLADNKIDFTLNVKEGDRDKYNIAGLFQQPRRNEYEFSLKPEGLVLNADTWGILPSNKLLITDEGVNANNFVLSKGSQQLSINSVNETANSPMDVSFSNFRISTLTGFIQTDSSLIDGIINGKAIVNDIMKDPVFTSDLSIADLRIKNDTAGNMKILVNNQTANTYAADITITGRGNDVKLSGNYYTNTSSFDMDLDIRQLPMTTAQAFSAGAIREASGSVNGKFDVTGNFDKPVVNGELNFNKAGFNLAMLNNYTTIDQEKLQVNSQGILFDRFEIKDSAGNKLIVNGTAATSNFTNYKFDLDIRSDNFRALNSTKKDNKLFYGQLYFNSNLKVTGTEAAPSIDGRLKVNEKTKMTVVLPQSEPGIEDREGIVEFVDMDAMPNDSLFLASYDSLNNFAFTGADISVNLEIDKGADLTLVIDEGNGDFLNVKGEALLSASVNPAGEIILAGTYDLEEGAYELSFNSIHRRFDIQKGSKIIWGGEPTDANVDISAKYIANTAPLDLVKGQLGEDITAAERNTYLQRLPFEVTLKMEGKLLKPKISFDIVLPDNKSYIVSNDIITNVRTKLDQLRQEEGEMNKQVFALLLLKRFVAENPFNSSTGINAGTLARQSVSKLMTEQLNRLADDLVKGVDLNFDVESSEDYTTGQREDRTELNVGLSKQLLNDRLTVTVGSNFELEAPQNSSQQASNIAGNVALNYKLSKDGRYQLRAYRKNEFQGVIDGYVIETGVGFVITLDYNRFKEIFQKKKIERQRQRRRAEREKQQQEESGKTPVPSTNP